MPVVAVDLKGTFDNSYDIFVKPEVLDDLVADVCRGKYGKIPVIICDDNTRELFGLNLLDKLSKEGVDPLLLTVPAGEGSKSLSKFKTILEAMLEAGITRSDCVIALGGGVVGDLSGYVAGSYMRGIKFVQVPTTLLSQVDSAVGGKVAVNIDGGKNYCGMFNQPECVYSATNALNSLPKKEILSGLGEVVKHGFIADREFTKYLLENSSQILSLDSDVMAKVVSRCCEIKAEVVSKDEKEAGLRQILNYGHTVGHAIEVYNDFKLTHGECVGYGMRIVAGACNLAGMLSDEDLALHNSLMDELSLATEPLDLDVPKILALMARDKKVKDGQIVIVGLKAIGEPVIRNDFPLELIEKQLFLMS